MPKKDTIVFIEPLKHYLKYSSVVLSLIANAFKDRYNIIEIKGDDANPINIDKIIQENDPIIVAGVGHGSPTVYTVECTQKYLEIGSERLNIMKERIIILNSCFVGKSLGIDLIYNGATAFYGSTDEFLFFIGTPPGTDRTSTSVFYAELQSIISLLNGKSVKEAHLDRLKKYDDEIYYWSYGEGSSHPDAALLVRILEIDKSIAVCYGEGLPITRYVTRMSVPAIIGIIVAGLITSLYSRKSLQY